MQILGRQTPQKVTPGRGNSDPLYYHNRRTKYVVLGLARINHLEHGKRIKLGSQSKSAAECISSIDGRETVVTEKVEHGAISPKEKVHVVGFGVIFQHSVLLLHMCESILLSLNVLC